MAQLPHWSQKAQKKLEKQLATLPPEHRATIEKYPPSRLYLLADTDQRVYIVIYEGTDSATVRVSGDYNRTIFERDVFGVKLSDLTECDLPPPDEPLGAILTRQEDIDGFIQEERDRQFGRPN